jgi:hypothetical protein
MSAAEESTSSICSRRGCAGPLHREDEVERGCQLAEMRTRIAELEAENTELRQIVARLGFEHVGECYMSKFSSRCCERGTKCCELRHEDRWTPCPKHAAKPEVNEGCGTVTCQECIRLNRGAR